VQIGSHVARYRTRLGRERQINHFTLIIMSPTPEFEHGSRLHLNGADRVSYRRVKNHTRPVMATGFASCAWPTSTPCHADISSEKQSTQFEDSNAFFKFFNPGR